MTCKAMNASHSWRMIALQVIFLLLICNSAFGQLPYQLTPAHHQYRNENSFFKPDTLLNKKKIGAISGIAGGTYGGVMVMLGTAWYADVPMSKFHFFNDSKEWLGIDKLGHFNGAYQGSRAMIQLLKWSGVNKRKTVIWGGLSGFVMMAPIEILDGYSRDWGFSWADMGANFLGAGLATLNEGLWNEQRIQSKVSFHPTPFAKVRPGILGDNLSSWLKDYNGHTVWLSFRVHSFLPEGKFKDKYPPWLNIALGYGAEGMLGGFDNVWTDSNGEERDFSHIRRYPQFYLSLDIDLTKIPTRIGFLKWLFGTLNMIKIPMPTLEISHQGLRFHGLYF